MTDLNYKPCVFLLVDCDCWEYRKETIVTVKALNEKDSAERQVEKEDKHRCTSAKSHRENGQAKQIMRGKDNHSHSKPISNFLSIKYFGK